jgi:hypothetical protein
MAMGKKQVKSQIVLIGCFLVVMILGASLPTSGATPWSWATSYSLRDQAQFQVGYKFNDYLGFDVAYQDLKQKELAGNRWLGRILLTPVDGVDLQVGYDLTGEQYLVGGRTALPLNENLRFVSALTKMIPVNDGDKYLDYLVGLEIGIGYNHHLLAGAEGLYQWGITGQEPELFVELDLNWRLPKNFGIRLQPHIGVEGKITHQTSVYRNFEHLQAGLFFGQDADARWDIGLYARY